MLYKVPLTALPMPVILMTFTVGATDIGCRINMRQREFLATRATHGGLFRGVPPTLRASMIWKTGLQVIL